ncbi:LysR family transcriptional regulator [Streptomyces sp. A7024]|uniref:LysR family transcriptional regulator n=1 Tax=Streptomyces coryli TaxID=1128680 RepID=A0A6G4TTD0_9ACTN|nr:LysR family transcriptional regulator [Streptomyces coryli]NGN63124.1 LysR family transcriptional regulator [Streptomyces coryli]
MLERHELEAFLTLAEELHFGRTAERLHVTTGRISQTIKKLERQTGAPLFLRTSRKVELTDHGRRLYDDLRPVYAQLATVWKQAVTAGRGLTGTLRAGFLGAAAGQLAAQAADLLRRRHPDHEVQLREVQVAGCLERVRQQDVDVLFLPLPHDEPDMVTGPVLFSEARMLAVPANHPLAEQETASMEDLATIPTLRLPDGVPPAWHADRTPDRTPQGKPIEIGPKLETMMEALAVIGSGAGALTVGAQLTRFYSRPDVTYLPLTDAGPLEWVPTWLASSSGPAVDAFVQAAREAAARVYFGGRGA